MKNLSNIFSILRQKNRKQYTLLSGCLFFSALLITAYCLMMRSPTVLNVLPVGGDSRKQVMMIFVLAVIGCGAFSLYAAGLFLRHKSREMGILLALGASKKILAGQLRRETGGIALVSCLLGMLLGTPLAWLIWQIFRVTLADTPEMALLFDFRAYCIPAAFSVFVILALFFMLSRSLKRTDILDIISEVHRTEPVRSVPRWFGAVGILLLIGGAALGYFMPSFFVLVMHWYPPEGFSAIFYLPALAGLYMLLLHTVMNGWRKGRSRYPHLIATSMMKFQGRQTVRNMLVVTVLTAGAYFAAFYVPMMVTPARLGMDARTRDYAFFCRADQKLPTQEEISRMAENYNVTVKNYAEQPSASLAVDGYEQVESDGAFGTTYTLEYREALSESRFLSESAWNALTGGSLDLAAGAVATVFDSEGGGYVSSDISLVTNPVTGRTLSVTPIDAAESMLKNDLLFGCRVLDDSDYANITECLTEEWRERQVFFDAENDSYDFAKALFYEIVARSESEVALVDGYDRIVRTRYLKDYGEYFLDAYTVHYDEPDSSAFRLDWLYMPKFRILDKADFTKQMAVFLLLFVFIALLCFAAVSVILYTRSMTLTLTNAWVYEDLNKLGASSKYLRKTARGQTARVFKAPIITGTLLILGLYLLILFGNSDDGITAYEWAGFAGCLAVTAVLSAALYGLYRLTLRGVWKQLGIYTCK